MASEELLLNNLSDWLPPDRGLRAADDKTRPVPAREGLVAPLCIAGMHRSGTSMVARLVRAMGVDLGRDEDLTPSKPENPDGFWENVRFVEVNDEILAASGGAWDTPSELSDASAIGPARAKAELAILAFEHGRPWAWKDPRNSVTLPFWRAIFPDMKLLVCIRNPLEVALSLSRRNLFSYESSLKLWLDYNQRILANSRPGERFVVHYDAFFSRVRGELKRLAEAAGLDPQLVRASQVADSIKPDLRHNRLTIENLSSAEVRRDILEVYLTLCSEAEWIDSSVVGPDTEQDEISHRISSFADIFRNHLPTSEAVLNRAAFERDIYRQAAHQLEQEIEHFKAQRDWLTADRDKLAAIIEQHSAGAEVQVATIRELQSHVAVLESRMREAEAESVADLSVTPDESLVRRALSSFRFAGRGRHSRRK